MKKYNVRIKTNSTCPLRSVVMDLIDKNSAAFKTVCENRLLRGAYPVYVDNINKDALYGFIKEVLDGDKPLDVTDVGKLIEQGCTITVKSYSGTVIEGELLIDDVKAANVDNSTISPKLQAAIDKKVSEGIVSKEEIDERIKVMQLNQVDEALKIKVVNGYRKYAKATHKPNCIYVDPNLSKIKNGREGIIAEGLRSGVNRMATICEGEKSVGKNVYMETIAWLMGMPLYMITFSRQMSPASIYGEKSTDNSASEKLKDMKIEARAKVMLESPQVTINNVEGAIKAAADFEIQKARAASVSIVIDQSELYDWLIDGGCMVLNELNMGESNFLSSFLNPLTDGTGFLFIPGRGEVRMHKDCILFGTQNAEYEGVQQQNEATMSRFNTLYFCQPESVIGQFKAATASALKKCGCDYELKEDYFRQAQKFYSQCMQSVHKNAVSNAVLNIRGFVRALTTVAESEGYCSLSRWLRICVIDTCPVDEREALAAILSSIVTL